MVAAIEDLPLPVESVTYRMPWGKTPGESIYLFDQEAAKADIVYFAEYGAGPWHSSSFLNFVNEHDKPTVERIATGLKPARRPTRNSRIPGWWTELEPVRLSKAHREHPWLFARYGESASDRDDGLNYTAFVFRDKDWTVFGIREWLGNDVIVRNEVLEKMAHRMVLDREFRSSLISDDPDLPRLWKKR